MIGFASHMCRGSASDSALRERYVPGLLARLVALAGLAPLATSGLPALLPCGDPFLLDMVSFSFFLRVPSLMSPPEPALPSVSLPEPWRRFAEVLGSLPLGMGGDPGREGGCRVDEDWIWAATRGCFFFCFLRADSLPLASESRGDPGRFLRLLEEVERLRGSACFDGRPEGVLVPEAPEDLDFFFSLSGVFLFSAFLRSSSFLSSSSFRRSVSVSSVSLWITRQRRPSTVSRAFYL